MAELRKHPLTNDWIMIASHRQGRPQMPKDYCPFCPGSGKVPEDYDVYKYDNDFPALSPNPPAPDDVATDFFETAPCYGKCEVILYSPQHTVTLPELPTSHIVKLVNLWVERYEALAADPQIKYVFIFENRGDVVGVTMPHPHGQIYGYPFLPKKLELEVENARRTRQEKGRCLFCDMLDAEVADGRRVIFRTEHFTVFLPFFSEYPYGVYIMSNAHRSEYRPVHPGGAGGSGRGAAAHHRDAGQPVRLQVPLHDVHVQRAGERRGRVRAVPFPHRVLSPHAQRGQNQVQRFQRNRRVGPLQPHLPGGDQQRAARRLRAVHEPVKKEPPPVWRGLSV